MNGTKPPRNEAGTAEPAVPKLPNELAVIHPAVTGPPAAPAKRTRTTRKTAARTKPRKTTQRKSEPGPAKADVPQQRSPSGRGRGRPSLSPRERAARPVTSTVADYVAWLNRVVFDGRMSGPQIKAAGISITLYGQYQISDERRRVRDGK